MRRGVSPRGGTGTIWQYSGRADAARPMSREQSASGEVSILRFLAWAALAVLALLVAVAVVFGASGAPTPS